MNFSCVRYIRTFIIYLFRVLPDFRLNKILIFIFLLSGLYSFAQIVHIDTLVLPPVQMVNQISKGDLQFPVIRTVDPEIEYSINKDLKNRFTNNAFSDLPTDTTLIKWAEEKIVYLDFEVTYLKNGIISLNISAEGCGAYCTGWTEYFTYSTTTGKYITLNEIVDTTGEFRVLVISDRDKQYEEQRSELRKLFNEEDLGLDEYTYNWVIEYYENCESSFDLNTFALHTDHLEIIENCYLPNVIKNMTPIIELKYTYTDIKEYLKIIK